MFCNKCGKQLAESARFCTACGNQVAKTETVQEAAPDEINPAFDAGEEKTIYLSEDDNMSENSMIDTPLTGNVSEEISQNAENDIPEIPEENFSEDPVSVDNDFLGEEKTVLIKEEDMMSGSAQEQPTQRFSQQEQPQIYPQEQTPAQDFTQQQMFRQPQPEPVYPQNQPPVGQYGQVGMIPDINAVPPVIPAAEIPAAPVKVGKGRIFGASAVAFFAVIFLILASLIASLKIGASGSKLNSRIKKLDLNTVLNAEYDGREVSDNLYGTVRFGTVTNGSASVSDFKEYLKKSDFLEYAGENVKNYADYIVDGKGKDPSISSEDFAYDFFGENNDAAYEVFDYELSKKDIKKIKNNLEEEEFDKNLSVKEWKKEIGIDPQNISYVLSYITIGILFALVLVLSIWIVIIVDKKGRHIMGFFGNILFISGIVVFLCGVGATAGMMVAFSATSNVVFYLVSNILLDFGILSLIIGFSELVAGFILKKVSNSIKRKKKIADAVKAQIPEPVPVYN